jgi:hypothetical protein
MDARPRKRKRPRRVPGEAVSPGDGASPDGSTPLPAGPRDDTAPADPLDARDRVDARRMSDDPAADRWIRLRWHETLQWLVTIAGLLIILAAIALLVRMLGGDPANPVVMILTSTASAVGGFAIRSAITRGRGGP